MLTNVNVVKTEVRLKATKAMNGMYDLPFMGFIVSQEGKRKSKKILGETLCQIN